MPWTIGFPTKLPVPVLSEGLTINDFAMSCDCVPCNRLIRRRRCPRYALNCSLRATSSIYLEPLPLEPDETSRQWQEVYGHEQRHVQCFRNYINGLIPSIIAEESRFACGMQHS